MTSENSHTDVQYRYTACLGDGQAEEKPSVSLMQYAREFAATANIKAKTKDTYRLMRDHLETYGDITIDKVTTAYLQGFIGHLQSQGLKTGTVRLYFQKLACVLHAGFEGNVCLQQLYCGEMSHFSRINLWEMEK